MDKPRERVLVLDDDRDLCEVLGAFFETMGAVDFVAVHSVDELVQHGDDALGCSLVILDVNLGPGEPNGIDALAWLRRHGCRGRIVFLTGHARGHVLSLATDGSFEVLEKPVDLGVLVGLMTTQSAGGA